MFRILRKSGFYIFIILYLLCKKADSAFGFSLPDIEVASQPKQSAEITAVEINEKLLNALILAESSSNPAAFEKKTQARGLTQIRPEAWKDLVEYYPSKYKNLKYKKDIFKPEVAKEAGRDYLTILKYYLAKKKLPVNMDYLLAAYNWGIGNLKRWGLRNAPEETKRYIKKIKSCLEIT